MSRISALRVVHKRGFPLCAVFVLVFVVFVKPAVSFRWASLLRDTANTDNFDAVYGVEYSNVTGYTYGCGSVGGAMDGGGAYQGGGSDFFVVAIDDATGSRVWTYTNGTSGDDVCNGISVDTNGDVVVVGYTTGDFAASNPNNGTQDFLVVKLNSTGSMLWAYQVGGDSDDYLWRVRALGSGGSVYAIGSSNSSVAFNSGTKLGDQDAVVIKLDGTTGAHTWTVFTGTTGYDIGTSISIYEPSENIYVAGKTNGTISGGTYKGGKYDAFTQKIDSSGASQWMKQMGNTGEETGLPCIGVAVKEDALWFAIGVTSTSQYGDAGGGSNLVVYYSSNPTSGFFSTWLILGTSNYDYPVDCKAILEAEGRQTSNFYVLQNALNSGGYTTSYIRRYQASASLRTSAGGIGGSSTSFFGTSLAAHTNSSSPGTNTYHKHFHVGGYTNDSFAGAVSTQQDGFVYKANCDSIGYGNPFGTLGACSPCASGQKSSQGFTVKDCVDCGTGTYYTADSDACKDCAVGEYQDETSSITCKQCSPGTFSSAEGSSSCTNCTEGTYNTASGSSSCSNCTVGEYQNTTGLTYCNKCEPGTYTDVEASATCKYCGAGTYMSNSGATSCLTCDKGSYANETGLLWCVGCSIGYYASETSATYCTQCPSGLTTKAENSTLSSDCGEPESEDDFDVLEPTPTTTAVTTAVGAAVATGVATAVVGGAVQSSAASSVVASASVTGGAGGAAGGAASPVPSSNPVSSVADLVFACQAASMVTALPFQMPQEYASLSAGLAWTSLQFPPPFSVGRPEPGRSGGKNLLSATPGRDIVDAWIGNVFWVIVLLVVLILAHIAILGCVYLLCLLPIRLICKKRFSPPDSLLFPKPEFLYFLVVYQGLCLSTSAVIFAGPTWWWSLVAGIVFVSLLVFPVTIVGCLVYGIEVKKHTEYTKNYDYSLLRVKRSSKAVWRGIKKCGPLCCFHKDVLKIKELRHDYGQWESYHPWVSRFDVLFSDFYYVSRYWSAYEMAIRWVKGLVIGILSLGGSQGAYTAVAILLIIQTVELAWRIAPGVHNTLFKNILGISYSSFQVVTLSLVLTLPSVGDLAASVYTPQRVVGIVMQACTLGGITTRIAQIFAEPLKLIWNTLIKPCIKELGEVVGAGSLNVDAPNLGNSGESATAEAAQGMATGLGAELADNAGDLLRMKKAASNRSVGGAIDKEAIALAASAGTATLRRMSSTARRFSASAGRRGSKANKEESKPLGEEEEDEMTRAARMATEWAEAREQNSLRMKVKKLFSKRESALAVPPIFDKRRTSSQRPFMDDHSAGNVEVDESKSPAAVLHEESLAKIERAISDEHEDHYEEEDISWLNKLKKKMKRKDETQSHTSSGVIETDAPQVTFMVDETDNSAPFEETSEPPTPSSPTKKYFFWRKKE